MTVLKKRGFRVVIRTNDHFPPHVHVLKAEGEIIIILNNAGLPEIDRNWMNQKDARAAFRLVADHQEFLLKKWREIHG